jgi:hypothetical protein
VADAGASPTPLERDARATIVAPLFIAFRSERDKTIALLRDAVAVVVKVDGRVRDPRPHWMLVADNAVPVRPGLVDRLRFASDELCVIGSELGLCGPYVNKRVWTVGESLAVFSELLDREDVQLVQLENCLLAANFGQIGLETRRALRTAIRDLRRQHGFAVQLAGLLGRMAA